MRKLTKPLDDPGIVFRTCISRVKNVDLKSRLTAIEVSVVAAANAFENAASTTTLHTLIPQNDVDGVTIDLLHESAKGCRNGSKDNLTV
jgi:hypothetical protein